MQQVIKVQTSELIAYFLSLCQNKLQSIVAQFSVFTYTVVTGTPGPLGTTPAPVFTQCDFDSGTLCGWTQASDDQFDWTIHQKNTGTSQTGPSYDHTTGSNNGNKKICLKNNNQIMIIINCIIVISVSVKRYPY